MLKVLDEAIAADANLEADLGIDKFQLLLNDLNDPKEAHEYGGSASRRSCTRTPTPSTRSPGRSSIRRPSTSRMPR
ncbi:MAG: hypothetical protein U0800_15750 [Isosphaeraceae bacterium]